MERLPTTLAGLPTLDVSKLLNRSRLTVLTLLARVAGYAE